MSNEELISWYVDEDVLVIQVKVESFDARNSKDIRATAEKVIGERRKVVLDLAAVEFMDSSGLGTLIPLVRSLSSRSGDLRLCGLQERVQMLFELTRLYRVFSIWPSAPDAIASFKA